MAHSRQEDLPSLVYAAKAAAMPYLEPAGPDVVDLSIKPAFALPGEPAYLAATIDENRFATANGTQPLQNIARAEYTIDTPPWITATVPISHSLSALDGAFDQVTEPVTATVDTSTLRLGRHFLFVRGGDAAGNWGVVSAVFLDVVNKTYLPITAKGASSFQ